MTFEEALLWTFHAILAALGAWALLALTRRGYVLKLASRFSHTVELPLVGDGLAEAAQRRIRRRNAATFVGGLAGLAASAVVLVLTDVPDMTFVWLITMPLTFTGAFGGNAVVSLRESLFPRHPDVVRVARPTAVTIHDYVSPRRLKTPSVLVILAVAAYLVGLGMAGVGLIDLAAFLRSAAAPLLAFAFAGLGVGAWATRRILDRPQPASSELELAWDDAFRADTFRSMWMFGSIAAWLAIAATVYGILQGLDVLTGTSWASGFGAQLYNWGILAAIFTFGLGSAQTFFRFRLWPHLEPVADEAPGGDQ